MSTTEKSAICVKTIDHVTIVVQDIDRSTRFYTEVLGMRQVSRPNFNFPGAWFQAGNTQIHLILASQQAGTAGIGDFDGLDPSKGFHYAFVVDDCHAAADQLREMGLEIVVGPRDRPDGVTQVYVYDPDGHLVELCSNPS
jgi:catechol 2,3-dioxygenase-like lactoylglutathione lyase family enzyme